MVSIINDPMRLSRLAIFVAVLFPLASAAAIRCEFNTELSSPPYTYRGTLIIDGNRSRADIVEGNHPLLNARTSVITREGGDELIHLDHERKTWSQRPGKLLGGHLSTTRGLTLATKASDEQVRTDRDGALHKLFASYSLTMNVEGETIPATVEIEVVSELGPFIRQTAFPWGLQFGAKTGFEKVDRLIERRMPMRLPVRQVVTASRQLDGGPKVSESIIVTLSNVTEVDIDKNIFFPPQGYRYENPVFDFGTTR